MCRNLEAVTPKNLKSFIERIDANKAKKCLIVNTTPITPGKKYNPLVYLGASGLDLTNAASKLEAKEKLTGLVSLPETAGRVFCEIV